MKKFFVLLFTVIFVIANLRGLSVSASTITAQSSEYVDTQGVKYSINTDGTATLEEATDKNISGTYDIPDNIAYNNNNYIVTQIGNKAFANCEYLKSVKISKNIEYIDFAPLIFDGCNSLTNIDVDPDNANYSSKDGILYNKDQTSALLCPPKKSGSVVLSDKLTSLDSDFFQNCSSVESITFPASISYISVDLFKNLEKLKEIIVNSDNKNYASIDGVLYDLKTKTLLKYPDGKNSEEELKLPNWVKSIERNSIPKGKVKSYILGTNVTKFEVENKESLIADKEVDVDAAIDSYEESTGATGYLFITDPNGHKIQVTNWYKPNDNELEKKYKFTPIIPGNYKLSFQFDNGVAKTKEITKEINVKDNEGKDIYSVSISKNSQQNENTEIKIGIEASDRFNFRFVVEKDGDFQTVKDFSKDKSFIWTPKENGVYDIYADIKDSDGNIQRQTIVNNYFYSTDPVYLCKDDEEKDIYNAISKNDNCSIDISKYTKDSNVSKDDLNTYFRTLVDEVCKNNNITKNIFTYVNLNDNNTLNFISTENNNDNSKDKELSNVVNNFKKNYIHDNYTDLQKELAVVCYITDNCEYNFNYINENPFDSATAYSALVNKKAICAGYAQATALLLNSCGVDCYTIDSSNFDHEWNIVKIDGKYYQLDTTLIDQITFRAWNYFNFNKDDKSHSSVDVKNKELQDKCTDKFTEDVDGFSLDDGKIYEFDDTLKCFYSTNAYNDPGSKKWIAYEDNLVSKKIKDKNYLYFIDKNNNVKSLNLATGEIKEFAENIKISSNYDMRIENDNLEIKSTDIDFSKNDVKITSTVQKVNINDSETISYKITFKDYDGTILGYQFVKDKSCKTQPKPANREGYTFIGWDKDLSNIDKDLVVTAVYWNDSKGPMPVNSQSTATSTSTATPSADNNTTSAKTSDSNNLEIIALLFAVTLVLIKKSQKSLQK